jgi:hypothetical protein
MRRRRRRRRRGGGKDKGLVVGLVSGEASRSSYIDAWPSE